MRSAWLHIDVSVAVWLTPWVYRVFFFLMVFDADFQEIKRTRRKLSKLEWWFLTSNQCKFCYNLIVSINISTTPTLNSARTLSWWFVFCKCWHFLRGIERGRVYFLLKDPITVSFQLHLLCNQTNHSSWWSVIAFRLACLHVVLFIFSLIFYFFSFMFGHLLWMQNCEVMAMEERDREPGKHLLST